VAITASEWEVEERPVPTGLRLVVPRRDLPLVSMRTCAECGEYAAFVRDGNSSWYACAVCGRFA
jgi:hypothetical protein